MNIPMTQGYAGMVVQCKCSHCGEMYASNYIHTCDNKPAGPFQQSMNELMWNGAQQAMWCQKNHQQTL